MATKFIPTKFNIYEDSTKDLKWGNYVNENVLLVNHPRSKKASDLTEAVMSYAAKFSPALSEKKTSLWDSLVGSGKVRMVDSDEVEWSLKGSGKVETICTENIMPGVKYPGHNRQEFYVKLDYGGYVVGDVIAPDIAKDVQGRVQYSPEKDGLEDYIYTLQLVDLNPNAYFEPELLEPGLNWCKIGASYGEASRDYGSTNFDSGTSYISFRTDLTDWGKAVEVTNKAHQLNLRAQPATAKGEDIYAKDYPAQIISWVEAEFLAQAKWEKEVMAWYGRAAGKSITDKSSGTHTRQGPGVMEFMEDANVITYPLGGFTIDLLRDFLQEVGWDTISAENSNVIVKTGKMGMIQAEKSIRELYSRLNVQVPWEKFVGKGMSFPGSKSPGYKVMEPSFLEVDFFPYGSLRFEWLPILDNRELNGSLVHPETNLPLSSYYYFIMDYGLGSMGNIELLRRKDSEGFTYICGTWSPIGPINNGGRGGFSPAHSGRSYKLTAQDTFGVRIKDVNLCAMVLPAVQY